MTIKLDLWLETQTRLELLHGYAYRHSYIYIKGHTLGYSYCTAITIDIHTSSARDTAKAIATVCYGCRHSHIYSYGHTLVYSYCVAMTIDIATSTATGTP